MNHEQFQRQMQYWVAVGEKPMPGTNRDERELQRWRERGKQLQQLQNSRLTEDPSVGIQDAWDKARKVIDAENKLVDQRMNWLMLVNGGLLAAYGVTFGHVLQLESSSGTGATLTFGSIAHVSLPAHPRSSNQSLAALPAEALIVISLIAIMFCRIMHKSITCAHRVLEYVTNWYKYTALFLPFGNAMGVRDKELDWLLDDLVCKGCINVPPLHLTISKWKSFDSLENGLGTQLTSIPAWLGCIWVVLGLVAVGMAVPSIRPWVVPYIGSLGAVLGAILGAVLVAMWANESYRMTQGIERR